MSLTELWCCEEDTYTAAGSKLLDDVKRAVRQVIAPAMASGDDAAHIVAIVTEAAQVACADEWNRRQDHPEAYS